MLKGFVSGEEKDIVRIPMKVGNEYQEGWEVRDNQDRLIWGREDELQTATGTLPFKGYGLPLKVKSLLGNAVQNGTPAPDNIITPEMCGVRTGNVCTPAPAETKTNNGITAVSNGSGTYHVSGTATADADIQFNVQSFLIPKSIGKGGSGTYSMFNSATYANADVKIVFYYQSTKIDDWGLILLNQTSSVYSAMGGKDCNAIGFTVKSGVTVDFTISPEFTNDGVLPTEYEPYGWKVPFENHGENLLQLTDGLSKNVKGVQFTINNQIITVSGTSTGSGGRTTKLSGDFLLSAGTYYLSLSGVTTGIAAYIQRTSDSAILGGSGNSFTVSTDVSVFIGCNVNENTVYNGSFGTMLSPGSTPKPYSPYLNETIPVYLGEVPTVRKVKKVVLTGEEDIEKSGGNAPFSMELANTGKYDGASIVTWKCSHYEAVQNSASWATYDSCISVSAAQTISGTMVGFRFRDTSCATVDAFKQFLADQYTSGTPVCVWYVLANEQTGIVNEPLCKISTYADELTIIQVHGLSAPLYGIGDYKDVLNLSTGVMTRKVKKLVLTGDENIRTGTGFVYVTTADTASYSTNAWCICTHYPQKGTEYCINTTNQIRFYVDSDADTFKSYLAAQYQAGTPVTIWYVLAEPETETVTVPTGMTGEIEGYLTQVSTPSPTNRSVPKWNGVEETGGTYAVTVYTPPEIPTTTGQNTLTVDSNLEPSKLEASVHAKKIHYGFKIDKSNDDSDSAVIYTHDAVTMTPAHMDFTNDRFDYGSWGNAFFVRDCYPVALNLDGTIAYRLDPDDYTKKTDGTASDIFYELLTAAPSDWGTQWKQYYTKSGDEYVLNDQGSAPTFAQDTYYKLTYNSSFAGNFMMAFPKVWFYRHEDSQYNYIEISNQKLSNDWKCYAHINTSGQEVDFIYLPLFKGVIKDSKLRSLPGQIPQDGTTATTEVNAATALGSRWQIWDHSSVECLNDLLTLMSKSIDSQGRFGQGRSTGYVSTDTVTYGKLQTGTLIKKGKFHGYSATTKEVKVFGIEGFWANRWDRLQGMLLVDNVWKIKMTPPYNFTGTDFVTLSNAEVPTGNGYLSKVQTSEYGSIPASIANGSSTKYFKDYFYKTATDTRVALRGGNCNNGGNAGFRYVNVNNAASASYWNIGASPVYK